MASGRDRGVLIVGHGTRDPAGHEAFLDFVGRLSRRLANIVVQAAFLEFASPTIGQAIHSLIERGVRRIRVVPLMLFAGAHVRRDIPRAVCRAIGEQQTRLGRQQVLSWSYTEHLGIRRAVVELSRDRYRTAMDARTEVPARQTVLVLVGRGSRDPGVGVEMRALARLRGQSASVGRIEVCYYAMAEPLLSEVLDCIAGSPWQRVVVQPHLLFPGLLLDVIRDTVERRRRQAPDRDWVLVEPLGADESLIQAVAELSSCGWSECRGGCGRESHPTCGVEILE